MDINTFFKKQNSKNQVKILTCGSVDDGKSTLIGRMIYELDQIKDGKYQELKKTSEKRGIPFEWAFLTDALQTERNQGITIDTSQNATFAGNISLADSKILRIGSSNFGPAL